MSQPSIILVNPQMGENIGGAARAMLNCGLEHLKLVNPRDGWPNERADAMSSGAFAKMPEVQLYDNVSEAVKDDHYIYATTSRPRDMVKPVMTPEEACSDMYKRIQQGQNCSVLFGGERAGLGNEDVGYANVIITAPLNPNFASLNLSQAVLMIAYEWSKHCFEANEPIDPSEIASTAELNNFFSRFEEILKNKGFFKEEHRQDITMRNIRNMIVRSELTSQEVRTYHGIISMLSKPNS